MGRDGVVVIRVGGRGNHLARRATHNAVAGRRLEHDLKVAALAEARLDLFAGEDVRDQAIVNQRRQGRHRRRQVALLANKQLARGPAGKNVGAPARDATGGVDVQKPRVAQKHVRGKPCLYRHVPVVAQYDENRVVVGPGVLHRVDTTLYPLAVTPQGFARLGRLRAVEVPCVVQRGLVREEHLRLDLADDVLDAANVKLVGLRVVGIANHVAMPQVELMPKRRAVLLV